MSLDVKETGGTFIPLEPGTHPARCVGLVDLGVQETVWQGVSRRSEKVLVVWEIPGQRTEDDKPRWISSTYTRSLNEKAALRRDLEAWRGKPFTPEELKRFYLPNLLNVPCLLSIQNKERGGKTYSNVSGVMKLPKGVEVPPLENKTFAYDMDDPNGDTVLYQLPEWMQKRVKESLTWKAREAQFGGGDAHWQEVSDDEEGGLPF